MRTATIPENEDYPIFGQEGGAALRCWRNDDGARGIARSVIGQERRR
jgi:hypothetical protein